ncbi:MAG: CBS domain-containing protein [Myxococcaceae bacterium]
MMTHSWWSQRSADAVTIDIELSVREALAVLSRHRLPSAPVLDDNRCLLGVVTWHDLLALLDRHDAEVEDAMTPAVTARESMSVGALEQLMLETGTARVHVVDGDGRFLGVVTALEVLERQSAVEAGSLDDLHAPAVGVEAANHPA